MHDALGQELRVHDVVLYAENLGPELLQAKIYSLGPNSVRLESEFSGRILTAISRKPKDVVKLIGVGINYGGEKARGRGCDQ